MQCGAQVGASCSRGQSAGGARAQRWEASNCRKSVAASGAAAHKGKGSPAARSRPRPHPGPLLPPCFRLHIRRGVPVWVVQQHTVGARQVDAQPADARGQQEAKHWRGRRGTEGEGRGRKEVGRTARGTSQHSTAAESRPRQPHVHALPSHRLLCHPPTVWVGVEIVHQAGALRHARRAVHAVVGVALFKGGVASTCN